MKNCDWGLDPTYWETVSMPAPAPAPAPVEEGVTSPYVPALQAESRKERFLAIAVAIALGLMLGYSILH